MGAEPKVELLWWPGCPSHEPALADLRAAIGELGSHADVEVVRIETEQDAEREGFPGSPTIRVNGQDLLPAGADEPGGLTCRLYRLRDGRVSPTPDPDDLRAALAHAMDKRAVSKGATDA